MSSGVKEHQAGRKASDTPPPLAEPSATSFASACDELSGLESRLDPNLARAIFVRPPAGVSADSAQAAAQALAVAVRDGVGDLLWEHSELLTSAVRADLASKGLTKDFGELHWTIFEFASQEAICQRLSCDLDYVLLMRCTLLKACGVATSLDSARAIALREGVSDAQWQQMLLLAQQELARRLGP